MCRATPSRTRRRRRRRERGRGQESDRRSRRCSMSPISRTAAARAPVTFLYNGGPGSSTMWLHMGAFGPRRVVTATDTHTPAAPYSLVNNDSSLLDASDLVFIDAPGTGFSRIAGKDKEKAFFGVDPDAHAFAEFIIAVPVRNTAAGIRPNICSAKATARRARRCSSTSSRPTASIDFNGVILLSQILNFDLSPDRPTSNPGIDLPYETGAADLCRDRLVSPQAARAITRTSRRCSPRSNSSPWAITRGRSRPGSDLRAADRAAIAAEAARLHGPAGRVHPEGRPAHRRRRVSPDAAGRRRHDHRPARHALLRPRHRPLEPARRLRSAIRARSSSAYVSAFNDYVAQGAALRRGKRSSRASRPSEPGTFSHAAGADPADSLAACRQCACRISPTR